MRPRPQSVCHKYMLELDGPEVKSKLIDKSWIDCFYQRKDFRLVRVDPDGVIMSEEFP